MATAQDVIDGLIKQTESGELEWEARTDGPGAWRSVCGEVLFQVLKPSQEIVLYGHRAPPVSLGKSSALVTMLQHRTPIEPAPSEDEVLQLALQCLVEKNK